MNPGETTQSEASMVCPGLPLQRPISTIFPPATATSACRPGEPVPSMTRPFRIRRSYAMGFPLLTLNRASFRPRWLQNLEYLVENGRWQAFTDSNAHNVVDPCVLFAAGLEKRRSAEIVL